MPKKYKLPTAAEFVAKRVYRGPKPEPVWIRIEREMREKAEKKEKPYNEVVGEWLKYLKDLRQYKSEEATRKLNRLTDEVGPSWYCEYSTYQRGILKGIPQHIHADLIENIPTRTRKALNNLGITLDFPKKMLLDAMRDCEEDAGVFMWNLYTAYYKTPPSELRLEYDKNSKLLMSGLVFVDMEECIETLNKLTEPKTKPKKPKPGILRSPKKREPSDPYLQKLPSGILYSNNKNEEDIGKTKPPPPLDYPLRIRSETSLENLRQDNSFLVKRKERNQKEKLKVRKAKYKFWEPPSTLRNTDPEQVAYINKCKMLTKKPRVRHQTGFENMQFNIGTVAYTGGKPVYLLNNVAYLPTGYYPINAGLVPVNGEMVTNIHGYWKYPNEAEKICNKDCDCVEKWEKKVMEYIEKNKCRCGHRYDFYNTGEVKEKYFYPATRNAGICFDLAKIYQFDSKEDFIKDTFKDALRSREESAPPTPPILKVNELEDKELVAIFLADLAKTPLILPHLPQANYLNSLHEWARKRVKGNLTPEQEKKLDLKSQRRWLDLKHVEFKAKAFRIPFTATELKHITWNHRGRIQQLFQQMLDDFVHRNRENQLQQARLWWATMFNDVYPSKAFTDTFFTYMPARTQDMFLIRPYSTDMVSKFGGKTCPLNLGIGSKK